MTMLINEEVDFTKIAKRINERRIYLGISQWQLAELCDISRVYISQIERGYAKPSLSVLINIANALNTTLNDLVIDCLNKDIVNHTGIISRIGKLSSQRKSLVLKIIDTIVELDSE